MPKQPVCWIIFSFSMLLVATFAFGDEQQDLLMQYGRETTNVQFNKDGSVGLIRLSKPTVEDITLEKLPRFPHLKYLAVVAPKVTNAGIQHISQLKELDTLFVSESHITADGLGPLRELTQLERISLTQLPLHEIPSGTFGKLVNVVSLSLAETEIGNSSVGTICELQKLQSLLLDETNITDDGLAQISQLKQLQLLSLCKCKITGKGFASFSDHESLKHLILSGTAIDDDGLQHIAKLKSLQTLELRNTAVTHKGVAALRESLNKTNIFFYLPHDTDSHVAMGSKSGDDAPLDLGPIVPSIDQRIDSDPTPDFQRHVIPLLGRLGCNSRSCHGSFQGRGGFRLSMFGYDFDLDHENLSDRIDIDDPDESLILNKPTSADDHEGGKRFEPGSWQQKVLQRWVATGAANRPSNAATFVRLDITPESIVFDTANQTQPLRAVAVWSDGTREDVTQLSRFETKDDAVADVDANGLVTAKGAGDTHIIAYYDNGIQPIQVIMPFSDPGDFDYDEVPTPTKIDEFVLAKLKKLGLQPSPLSTDEAFLRRVSLDMIGTLPKPDEIKSFIDDTAPDKRDRKIDELLEHPAYVACWTNRLCDLTGANAGYLGGTEMALPVSLQWQAWIERRVRDNVGWDKIACDLITSTSRRPGQTYRDYAKQQSEFTRRVKPSDYTEAENPMPHYWYRDNIRIPSDKTLSFGYVFLGLRLDCAQCHKHPFDRWSQNDFAQFTEFFTRIKTGLAPDAVAINGNLRQSLGVPVKLDTAALRRQSYLRIAAEGRQIPWNEVWIEPAGDKPQMAKLLGADEIDLAKIHDPRVPLADWLQKEPNQYLAKAFVNRIWANYFGIGIVNPTDDLNLANPPSHPKLMEYLTEQFVEHNYDMKWLHKTIASSRTYQLSWKPNESNITDLNNYSHATLRRLPAEVIVDAIQQATLNSKTLKYAQGKVANRKINQHPKSYQTRSIDYSLLVFGKSLRTANCDCERNLSPTLPQALYIRNDHELLQWIDRKDGWIAEISSQKVDTLDVHSLVTAAYLRTLSRRPNAKEVETANVHFSASENHVDAVRDLLWALLNTQEFIANH